MSHPFGRYHLLEFVASGGMADVYRAESLGAAGFVKPCAIKVIRGDFSDRPDLVEMFQQEARLASGLTHPNIVQVFDFNLVGDRYYIAMEFVQGRTLGQLVNRCKSSGVELGLPRAVHVCAQVASALAFAHRLKENGKPLGIVHRDVSPQNVLVSFEGDVKLTDFGIARAMNAVGLTQPGVVKGKPAYMAPEQARGHEVDARADVFALGVVLWELCCGFNLFQRQTESASLLAVIGPEPEIAPPSRWNPDVSPELDRAILGALDRDPERRTPSAQELALQLQSVLFKVAPNPAALDLRPVMGKLWPEGATAPGGAPLPAALELSTPDRFAPAVRPGTAERQSARSITPPAPERAVRPDPTPTPKQRTPAPQHRERGLPLAERPVPERAGLPTPSTPRLIAMSLGAAVVLAGIGTAFFFPSSRVPDRAGDPSSASATPTSAPPSPQLAPVAPGRAPEVLPAPAAPGVATSPSPTQPAAKPVPSDPPQKKERTPPLRPARKPERRTAAAPAAHPGVGDAKPASGEQATLEIFSTTWALISVDGKQAGYTPLTLTVAPGPHRVRAEHAGLVPVEQTITLDPGESGRWSPLLRPPQP